MKQRIKFHTYDGRVLTGVIDQTKGSVIKVKDEQTDNLHVIDSGMVIENLPEVITPVVKQIGR